MREINNIETQSTRISSKACYFGTIGVAGSVTVSASRTKVVQRTLNGKLVQIKEVTQH